MGLDGVADSAVSSLFESFRYRASEISTSPNQFVPNSKFPEPPPCPPPTRTSQGEALEVQFPNNPLYVRPSSL